MKKIPQVLRVQLSNILRIDLNPPDLLRKDTFFWDDPNGSWKGAFGVGSWGLETLTSFPDLLGMMLHESKMNLRVVYKDSVGFLSKLLLIFLNRGSA